MAGIRIGNFGQAVAPTQPGSPGLNSGVVENAFVDRAAPIMADAMLSTSTRMLRAERSEQTRIQREQEAEAKAEHQRAFIQAEQQRLKDEEQTRRNKAGVAWASYQVESSKLAADLQLELTEGRMTREAAQKALDDGLVKAKATHMEGLDDVSKGMLADNLILADGKAKLSFQQALQQHARQERAGAYNQTRETLQRLALTDPASAIAQMKGLADAEGVALFGAERASKDFQQFKEGVIFVDIDRRITAAERDGRALAKLKTDLAGEQYADLAPERRNALEAKIEGKQRHLAHLGEVAERRRLTALQTQFQRLSWYTENGREPPMTEFDAFAKASKGTPFAGMADVLIAERKAVNEIASLPPAQMHQKLREIEASYGETPTREQIMHLDKMRRYVGKTAQLLSESPLEFARSRDGATVDALDMTKPDSWVANLQSRTGVLKELQARTGAMPKGLLKEEAEAFRNIMASAPTEQKRVLFAQLRQGFGDEKIYRATVQQIAPDDPVLAAAGVLAAKGLEQAKAWDVSGRLLRGQELLRPDPKTDGKPGQGRGKALPMPNDEDMRLAWAGYARNTFADQTEIGDRYFQAAKALYAQATDASGDLSGNIDSRRWRKAMEEATGGMISRNGRGVLPPYGMTEDAFRDSLRDRFAALESSGRLAEGMTADKLAQLPMQNVGDGRYVLRAGDGVLGDKTGNRIIIDFDEVVAPPQPATRRRRTSAFESNEGGAATGVALR